jgi:hypothetical protein
VEGERGKEKRKRGDRREERGDRSNIGEQTKSGHFQSQIDLGSLRQRSLHYTQQQDQARAD